MTDGSKEASLSSETLPRGRIAFRVLGTLDLRRPDGQRIDALLSQPRRLALLAYLAAATPRGLHSRDRLATLFSPEADQQRARQALRQALSVLRGELGPEAIVTVGDGEVGLDSSVVMCDVVAFDAAVAAGRSAEALDLYGGEFLEGFFVSDAPEFERWQSSERARLARDASLCARVLMDQCEASADLAAAAIWARRARQLAPDDEVLVRRLMQLLDRTGNRAAALQVYEEFAAWLKREFEVEPSPETQALVAAIRSRVEAIQLDERGPQPVRVGPSGATKQAADVPLRPTPALAIVGGITAGVLAVAAAVAIAVVVLAPKPPCMEVPAFIAPDASLPAGLGDSLGRRVAGYLQGFPDFVVRAPGERCAWLSSVKQRVEGDLRSDGAQRIVEAKLDGVPLVRVRGPEWGALADSVAWHVVVKIYRGSLLESTLPLAVLPRTPGGWIPFVRAEKLFAEGRWTEAGEGYARAEVMDSTCYLCSWRIAQLGRWTRQDPQARPSYLAHVDLFPGGYRSLIHAMHSPLRERLDTLSAVTREWRYFLLGWFELGDELFHTGALVGRSRREAVTALIEATKIHGGFAPAWEHLAWALALEGDSAGAYAALDSLKRLRNPRDPNSMAIHALVIGGLAWRFEPPPRGEEFIARILRDPRVWEFAPLSSGPRYLPTFGSPHGALGVGRIYLDLAQQKARPDFAASARVARALGYLALGREDSARDEARELADQERTPELALLVHEIEAALLVLDPSPGWLAERWPGLSSHLPQFAESRSAAEGVRRRAAFSYTLVARRAGDSSDRYTWVLEREPAPQPLGRLLAADSLARSGRLREALDVSEPLTELLADTLGRPEPAAPFFRSVLHVLRAEWYRKLGNVQDAGAELIWHQNLDEERGWLTGAPQVGEADWALATLGHWRLASLSDEAGETGTPVCHAYAEVVRLWSGGEPRYAARADTARARRAALGCERGGPAGGSRTAGEPREAGTERS